MYYFNYIFQQTKNLCKKEVIWPIFINSLTFCFFLIALRGSYYLELAAYIDENCLMLGIVIRVWEISEDNSTDLLEDLKSQSLTLKSQSLAISILVTMCTNRICHLLLVGTLNCIANLKDVMHFYIWSTILTPWYLFKQVSAYL